MKADASGDSRQTTLDQSFFKANKPAQRYIPNLNQMSDAEVAASTSVRIPDNNRDAAMLTFHRPYVYILPCYIPKIWSIVSLNLQKIRNRECQVNDVINLMKSNYNSHLSKPRQHVNLQNLADFFDEQSHNRLQYYQNQLLPSIAKLALMLPQLFENQPILMMIRGEQSEQQFTKHQIAAFLANLFFMTLHDQPCKEEDARLPFECSSIFLKSENPVHGMSINSLRKEKIKFLFAYFEAIEKEMVNLDLIVSFERLQRPENFQKRLTPKTILDDESSMPTVIVYDERLIEEGEDLIQISFANCRIGGGALSNGSLQEEIKYLSSPECLISIFIFEELDDEEAILIQGAQKISNYTGYANTLKFTGLHDSSTYLVVQEQNNMLNTFTVGIDAFNFKAQNSHDEQPQKEQFSIEMVMREIRKALVGFSGSKSILPVRKNNRGTRDLITGNWGCGDFGGDKQLKFLIQWIAASLAGKKTMHYCTHRDAVQKIEIEEIVNLINNYEVKEIFRYLRDFLIFKRTNPTTDMPLFLYILTFMN